MGRGFPGMQSGGGGKVNATITQPQRAPSPLQPSRKDADRKHLRSVAPLHGGNEGRQQLRADELLACSHFSQVAAGRGWVERVVGYGSEGSVLSSLPLPQSTLHLLPYYARSTCLGPASLRPCLLPHPANPPRATQRRAAPSLLSRPSSLLPT